MVPSWGQWICRDIGPAIKTSKEFEKALSEKKETDFRGILMRGLIGGIENYPRNVWISMSRAVQVMKHFEQTWDVKVIKEWVANSGRKRRAQIDIDINKPTAKKARQV